MWSTERQLTKNSNSVLHRRSKCWLHIFALYCTFLISSEVKAMMRKPGLHTSEMIYITQPQRIQWNLPGKCLWHICLAKVNFHWIKYHFRFQSLVGCMCVVKDIGYLSDLSLPHLRQQYLTNQRLYFWHFSININIKVWKCVDFCIDY